MRSRVHVTVIWSLSLLVFDNHILPLSLSCPFPAESKHCEKRRLNNPAPKHFIHLPGGWGLGER